MATVAFVWKFGDLWLGLQAHWPSWLKAQASNWITINVSALEVFKIICAIWIHVLLTYLLTVNSKSMALSSKRDELVVHEIFYFSLIWVCNKMRKMGLIWPIKNTCIKRQPNNSRHRNTSHTMFKVLLSIKNVEHFVIEFNFFNHAFRK